VKRDVQNQALDGIRRVLGEGRTVGATGPFARERWQAPHARPKGVRGDGLRTYVLRTGIQWNALPRELGASSTVHARFQEWEREGFFEELWRAGLVEYEELEGIEWEWQSMDGVMTKAPFRARRDRSQPH
jgi:hypothetical protein